MAIQGRIFEIVKPALKRHYEINLSGGSPLITVGVSNFTPGVPELTFHDGPDAKNSPVFGFCDMHKTTSDIDIGLIDPQMPQKEWRETLSKESFMGGEYKFSMTMPGGRRQTFTWDRTHSVGVGGHTVNPLSTRNFMLLDEQGATLAVFTSASIGLSTCGELEIKADMGRHFDQMVIMTCLAIYDKAARRKKGAAARASATSVT
ncbi:hypothetical protein HJFPF1_10989 [Paramyrothecium foliicola]|nr:hypothetical protein HJFPF1_10989 [Paramyrothecium foliicola]